jgi:hypothetical protein
MCDSRNERGKRLSQPRRRFENSCLPAVDAIGYQQGKLPLILPLYKSRPLGKARTRAVD